MTEQHAMSYEQALAELYRSAPEQFVAERRRLAGELKAAGDQNGAKKLAKLPRPNLSAWAVNQLWWHAREDFEQLFASAARLRGGDLDAARAHRGAIDRLRARAAAILAAGSHAASDAVLRRVSTTLAALAAHGGFDPDPPGALSGDREAPGFDAAGLAGMLAAATPSRQAALRPRRAEQEREHAEQACEQLRAEQERERLRAEREHERQRLRAGRERLQAELEQAQAALIAAAREVDRLRTAIGAAERDLARARAAAADVEAQLLCAREEESAFERGRAT